MRKAFWRGLPWDGMGWAARSGPGLPALRLSAAREWRAGFPLLLRPLIFLADRLGWSLAAFVRTVRFARAVRMRPRAALRLYGDCLASGGSPIEVHVWRALHGERHPLPARSAARLLSRLGDPAGHKLLADKLALAERLSAHGIALPPLHAHIPRGSAATLDLLDLLDDAGTGTGVFVKPRHGRGGAGGFAVTRSGTAWHVEGRPVPAARVLARLDRVLARDDALVQPRLVAADALADLAPHGHAPVLRLATAWLQGGAPFLHSALLMLVQPGQSPRDFLHGMVFAPLDPATGAVSHGICFARPRDRVERLGADGARLAGRRIPDFDAAVALALRAMAEVPPLALVHWDIIVTPSGPILLEGNSAGNWILATLPGLDGLDAGPLAPILEQWHAAARLRLA